MNATYIQVRIRVGVRFTDPNHPDFYRQKLSEDLSRFLAPWAYDEGADIIIGQRIYANSLIGFIDERPYVDYVAGIKLFTSEDGQTFVAAPPCGADEDEFVSADRPDAILTSARQHEIDLITDDIYQVADYTGLNQMKIELDFIVT